LTTTVASFLARTNLAGSGLKGADLRYANLKDIWLFRILYAGFARLNEFSELSALSHSPEMFAINICIQDLREPDISWNEHTNWEGVQGLETAENVPEALKQQLGLA